jgi:hypothetical protein
MSIAQLRKKEKAYASAFNLDSFLYIYIYKKNTNAYFWSRIVLMSIEDVPADTS